MINKMVRLLIIKSPVDYITPGEKTRPVRLDSLPRSYLRTARRYTGYNALRCNPTAGRSASNTYSYLGSAERLHAARAPALRVGMRSHAEHGNENKETLNGEL